MDFELEIKKRLNEKYNFLKLFKVVYNTTFCNCVVCFLYPENIKTLSDDNKQEITNVVKDLLQLNGKIECKFTKSFLDKDIILVKIKQFVDDNFASISQFIDDEHIGYLKDGLNVTLQLKLNNTLTNYVESNEVIPKLQTFLSKNFCANFLVESKCFGNDFSGDNLEIRAIEAINNLPKEKKSPRYKVTDAIKVFGSDILLCPELIVKQEKEKQSVILAGIVTNLEEKQYLPRANKEKNIDEKRKFYSFTLTDYTGSIDAVHFCNKTSEKHFSKLIQNETQIICIGNIKKKNYGNGYQYIIKSISLCKDDESSHINFNDDESIYKYAVPEPYIRTIQGNIFDKKKVYPDWIMSKTWVVFDCETTGLEPDKNDITEIGAVKIVDGQIVKKFQHLCKPFETIPDHIINITGITNAMVENEPSSYDILKDFLTFAKDSILVGYNVAFDYQFICNVAKRKNETLNFETRDCMVDAKNKIKFLPNYKLGTLVSYLGVTLDNAHRALYDATATAEAFLALSLIDE